MKIKRIAAAILATALLFTGCSEGSSSGGAGVYNISDSTVKGNVSDLSFKEGEEYAVITVKDFGDITVKLYPDTAPVGVANFIELAKSGYYDGKSIHRIIPDFIFQGGSLNGDGASGTAANGGEFDIEIDYNMRHFYGALCYANKAGKNTCQFYVVNSNESEDISSYKTTNIKKTAEQYKTYAADYEKDSDEYNYFMNQYNVLLSLINFIDNASPEVIEKYKKVGGAPSLDGGYTVFGQTVAGFDVIDAVSAVRIQVNASTNEESQPVDDVIIESVKIKTYTDGEVVIGSSGMKN